MSNAVVDQRYVLNNGMKIRNDKNSQSDSLPRNRNPF